MPRRDDFCLSMQRLSRQLRAVARRGSCICGAAAASALSTTDDWRQREPKDVRVLVVGATGYIGKFVTKELVKRGYETVALAREASGMKGKSTPEDVRKVRPHKLLLITAMRQYTFEDVPSLALQMHVNKAMPNPSIPSIGMCCS